MTDDKLPLMSDATISHGSGGRGSDGEASGGEGSSRVREGRSLAYLTGIPTDRVKGIGPRTSKRMHEAGIASVTDLLLHAPRRYLDRSQMSDLSSLPLGKEVTVAGTITSFSKRRISRNRTMIEAVLTDGTSRIKGVWFNPYLKLQEGAEVAWSGKAERFRGALQMKSPAVDPLREDGESLITGRVVPIHPKVAGLGPQALRKSIHNALVRSRPIAEPLPQDIVERLRLVSRDTAIAGIHFPETRNEADQAHRRLVFDELFRLEVALALRKQRQVVEAKGVAHDAAGALVKSFLDALPYELTGAQKLAIDDIETDLVSPHPMHRLLQGEVGSGKTVVALAALLTGIQGGYQGAVMAPTEVLAEQHYLGVLDLLERAGMQPEVEDGQAPAGMTSLFEREGGGAERDTVRVGLLTANSSEVNFLPPGATKRVDLIEWISDGNVDLVVGTHSLIQDDLHFGKLGIAVVDEQHRFGVYQRVQLREKGSGYDPDLLIMTATPIPRTLAMTLYGDLDVSTLDEMPPGRQPVETIHVTKDDAGLEAMYDLVRREVAKGHQAFVVCPLVEDSDKLEVVSATAEHDRLQGVWHDLRLGLLHGQLRPRDKDEVMHRFRANEIDVLVATTVIEVGIDIPNATVMVIEDADRFGLSQLHQLRGRVGRGAAKSTCVLVAEPTTPEGERRITAMVSSNDGFQLAEVDLEIRGQGTVFGARQAGLNDLKLADILRDRDELTSARREAFALVANDPELRSHPDVAEEVRALLGEEVEWLFRS